MPAISSAILVDSILNAIQESGGLGIYVSESMRTHPRRFMVQYLEQTFSLSVYIWTLTFGGRQSLSNEYRIQMTSVTSPLPINRRIVINGRIFNSLKKLTNIDVFPVIID